MSDIIQGSEQWFASRLGRVGASRIADVMAGGTGATRKNYMMELLCQRLTGKYADTYTSPAMLWGIENEDLARTIYELETGSVVKKTGGYGHPTIPMCGASPDGLVMFEGEVKGLLEIKCPNTSTFIDFWHTGKIPRNHQLQMTWQMICTGTKWVDYVQYDPRMPSNCNFKIVRFHFDEKSACEITEAVVQFLSELDELEKEFK